MGAGTVSNPLKGKEKLVVTGIAVLMAVVLLVQSFTVIQAGTVGVVKRLGAVESELPP